MIVPVILSGGAGTRLWPLSRELHPKQLLPLAGARTLLQETFLRLQGLPDLAPPLVVCNEEHRFMVAEQLRAAGGEEAEVLLEPVGRNTAPAAAVAALRALEIHGGDPLLLLLPADHAVADPPGLRRAVAGASAAAGGGCLVTFGVVPTSPETGYGYIRAGEPLSWNEGREGGKGNDPTPEVPGNKKVRVPRPASRVPATAFAVAEFVEKPDVATARKYLDSGDYYWNSGMFLFRASRYLGELEKFAPEMVSQCREALAGAKRDLDFVRLEPEAFSASPADSIDYAVMEKTDAAAVVPLEVGWNDVGSWAALWETGERDPEGNVQLGDVRALDVKNCYLRGESRLVAAIGLEDLIVVETADAVLVAAREKVQKVKELVAELKREGREEVSLHRQVDRPWGAYECIDRAPRYQVKRITVRPGARLSLQLHHHRAEHWVVVRGTARITKGEEILTLSENQSAYIPLGVPHRLENPGKIPLEIIEVQSGSYLGEDDIVRIEDHYGR